MAQPSAVEDEWYTVADVDTVNFEPFHDFRPSFLSLFRRNRSKVHNSILYVFAANIMCGQLEVLNGNRPIALFNFINLFGPK